MQVVIEEHKELDEETIRFVKSYFEENSEWEVLDPVSKGTYYVIYVRDKKTGIKLALKYF